MSDSLGDRIKRYEKTFSHTTIRRTPLIIRVDGRAFHTLTRGLEKPFDKRMMEAMIRAAEVVAKDMQGFKVAYVQSDEVTFLLTDYDTLETEAWFGYKISKVVSISASLMSVAFNEYFQGDTLAIFDSRAFSVPKEEVVNTFLWRAQDWKRNSLQMYSRSVFSHKQLHKKNQNDMQDMLHNVGKNWSTDLSGREKNGTFLVNTGDGIEEMNHILPSYDSINNHIGKLLTPKED